MSQVRTAHQINNKTRTGDVLISENVDFPGLLLSEPVLRGLAKSGFERPSPIQLKAIPIGRCGLDLIVQAKSGTGKTCVFTVIALESLSLTGNGMQVLVLAPTREIAVQIWEVVTSIGAEIPGLKCHTFIGGLPLSEDKIKLRKCHVAIGTPGRVKQLIETSVMNTESIRLFVLDEADKLLEENFQDQINWIYSTLPENKQMMALSATYPEVLAEHLTRYMRDPVFVRLNSSDPALLGIKQFVKTVPFHPLPHKAFDEKVTHFLTLLSSVSFNQCLVFSNYQTRAQTLSDILNSKGWPSTYISGSQDQHHRMDAMSKLKNYKCRILISTDLTSRGIDAENVNLVVNLDLPYDHETYLHRIGRAGRFGTYGAGVTYVCAGEESKKLHQIEQQCNTVIQPLPDALPADLTKSIGFVNVDHLVTTEHLITTSKIKSNTAEDVSNGNQKNTFSEIVIKNSCKTSLNTDSHKPDTASKDTVIPSEVKETEVVPTSDLPKNEHSDFEIVNHSDLSRKETTVSTLNTVDTHCGDEQTFTEEAAKSSLFLPSVDGHVPHTIDDFHIPTLKDLERDEPKPARTSYNDAVNDYIRYTDSESVGNVESILSLYQKQNCQQMTIDSSVENLFSSVADFLKNLTFDKMTISDDNKTEKSDVLSEVTKENNEHKDNTTTKEEGLVKDSKVTEKITSGNSSSSLQGKSQRRREPRFNPMAVSGLFLRNSAHDERDFDKVHNDANKSQAKSVAEMSNQNAEMNTNKLYAKPGAEMANLTSLNCDVHANNVDAREDITSDFRLNGEYISRQKIKSINIKDRPDLFCELHIDTNRPQDDEDLTEVSELDANDASDSDLNSSTTQSESDSSANSSSSESDSESEEDHYDENKLHRDYSSSRLSYTKNDYHESKQYFDENLYGGMTQDNYEEAYNHDSQGAQCYDVKHPEYQAWWHYYNASVASAYSMYNYQAWHNYAMWMGACYASAYIEQFHQHDQSRNARRIDWERKLNDSYFSQVNYMQKMSKWGKR